MQAGYGAFPTLQQTLFYLENAAYNLLTNNHMKPFNHRLSLNIDAMHVRIDYVRAMPKSEATKRRLKALQEQLRELERRIRV